MYCTLHIRKPKFTEWCLKPQTSRTFVEAYIFKILKNIYWLLTNAVLSEKIYLHSRQYTWVARPRILYMWGNSSLRAVLKGYDFWRVSVPVLPSAKSTPGDYGQNFVDTSSPDPYLFLPQTVSWKLEVRNCQECLWLCSHLYFGPKHSFWHFPHRTERHYRLYGVVFTSWKFKKSP